ncbi:hypothetical protein SAV14893_070470 [Streptomyces avermitilis]|uniref:Uncharacterized protein n=1 Tax=Streptomyces avermitilis TaxID=33903 RepID=A0A4D4MJ43_STRAX|nr:hypothetical protein SAVMC3_83270 [Streptomyces avermitilis]GDY67654.1 hypothetical protein SAV14893_070470 [Streptomyces avermitilis]GDY72040.1 hypothetical protein SAV31267_015250 [Streptomyces avermitilis]GDY81200.1 hypothetical protein SAVCW2_03990 [Streptomyces avermitilis]
MGSLIRTALVLLSTYETVARETPARRATSALVGTERGADGEGTGSFGMCTMTYGIFAEDGGGAPYRGNFRSEQALSRHSSARCTPEHPFPGRKFEIPYRVGRRAVTVR